MTTETVQEALTANEQGLRLHRYIITVGDAIDAMHDEMIENEVNEILEKQGDMEDMENDYLLDLDK